MQKIYFDNTMFFRENGKAHNKVEAFGYCVSFKDTYCKSMKIEKIVISTNPSIPAYSGERHNKNTGKRIHTANMQIPVDWCVHSRISGAPILK